MTTFAGFAVGAGFGARDGLGTTEGLARATDADGSTALADGPRALEEVDGSVLGAELEAVGEFWTFAEQAARPVTTATAAMIATPRDAGCMMEVEDTPRLRDPFP